MLKFDDIIGKKTVMNNLDPGLNYTENIDTLRDIIIWRESLERFFDFLTCAISVTIMHWRLILIDD